LYVVTIDRRLAGIRKKMGIKSIRKKLQALEMSFTPIKLLSNKYLLITFFVLAME
jgi:hypothetical protein